MATMANCPACGAAVQPGSRFCTNCGRSLAVPELTAAAPAAVETGQPVELGYRITASRILLLTILSNGLYFLYWFYLTWKQYGQHTGRQVYPVWHALTLFLPVYSLFRTHAHVRSYKELMKAAGAATTLSLALSVTLVGLWWGLSLIELGMSVLDEGREVASGQKLFAFFFGWISLGVGVGFNLHVQDNLNRLWSQQPGVMITEAHLETGEIVISLLGVGSWLIALADLAGLLF